MPLLKLIIKELLHRKGNFVLSAVGVTGTVAFIVGFLSTAEASRRETTRVMRDMGFNLRIIPKETDMDRFWASGFSDQTMAEETVERFAAYDNVFFSYNHLVASLQKWISVGGREVILTGLSPAIAAAGKKPMGFSIKPGTVELGHQVALRLGLKKGDTLEIGGRSFIVERTLVESGTDDDIRVFARLNDAQQIANLPGRINEIKAIDCLCLTSDQDPLKILREELKKALPEAKVLQIRSLADARARQRQMVEKTAAFITPFLLIISAAWVAVLAVLNVRERRYEIGVMRALGHGSVRIGSLFLGKAMLVGIVGAIAGFAVGIGLALSIGPDIFKVTAKSIRFEWTFLIWAIVAAPLFAAFASLVPAALAITQDPSETLRVE